MGFFTRVWSQLRQYSSRRESTVTVKYMFPALIGAVAVLSLASVVSMSVSTVILDSQDRVVEVGDIFAVEVLVSAHTPINAVDISVAFPADKVEVFGVDRGQSVLTLWTEDPIIGRSSVDLRGGTFRKGFIGEHQIAIINFRAKATGLYNVDVSNATFVAGDGAGTIVPVTATEASTLAFFTFDETTSESEIRVAISTGVTTDLNNDGQVDLQDISAFMGAWSSRSQIFDFNRDGQMTFRDFSIILADFFLR